MKRLAVAVSIAAALALTPAAAEASTGHTCPTHCTPAPTPPPGGWKCQQTHTCRPPKHPHCPPKKHHHRHPKPPVVTPPSSAPIPPVKTAPKPHHVPAARVRLVADVTPTQLPTQLAYTGAGDLEVAVLGGPAAMLLGGALIGLTRTPSKQRKAWTR